MTRFIRKIKKLLGKFLYSESPPAYRYVLRPDGEKVLQRIAAPIEWTLLSTMNAAVTIGASIIDAQGKGGVVTLKTADGRLFRLVVKVVDDKVNLEWKLEAK